jgi:hypothetical protein
MQVHISMQITNYFVQTNLVCTIINSKNYSTSLTQYLYSNSMHDVGESCVEIFSGYQKC